ncbi:hypothetical protein H8B06_13330 [Sphingobacterium sp. DN00404]|uniref:Lipopolysaccharide biosynthesis protein n=1 Tax=Sphingobacterium micropteri TaxID=2763501 RepID=A0ABR7YRK8_9SPHI|nr:hypothetical protein [Sphingobacterium micropteri]MBD1433813.1 hypothetical protein [Sphingobacterium micropteri]
MFKDKTIILAVHEYADFSTTIRKSLEQLGFTVIELDTHQPLFKYKNLTQRFHNFFRKTFLKDRNYKHQLKQKAIEEQLLQQLESHTHVDYALLIRADILPESVIDTIRKKTDLVAAYQWDGLDRFPIIYDYIPRFDRFFVFDSKDLSVEKVRPATNFYFDYLKVEDNRTEEVHASFVGSYFEYRNQILKDIARQLLNIGVKTDISIFSQRNHEIEIIQSLGFAHLDTTISYEDNLTRTMSSDILIDVHVNDHKGLSFRILEALGYDKKIITTNTDVMRYDFYQPENIFVWTTGHSTAELKAFIDAPPKKIEQYIKHKYSFTNWITYILNKPPYTTIQLPK